MQRKAADEQKRPQLHLKTYIFCVLFDVDAID